MSSLFHDLPNFNADISNWDTSKVTTMQGMFYVRSARAPGPCSLESVPPNARQPQPRALISGPYRLPHRIPAFTTRQGATAFNQPLSFDKSKVTDMGLMFHVRSARALAPTALSRAIPVHAENVAATPLPHASFIITFITEQTVR